ncbi:hypothetical protein HOP52_04850 [Halomonas campisalis]|uniref:Chromosome partition protein Smc n=1 Tax=Billgrantia campisalis TaxID=74661 RepID=A0ABS9P5P6_9GAMM|nr:hypothetical protein [Halomonas campisalis]MCG6657106.1 hypothetical protein [Halomonas campisalis]MDR5862291.1 hypothetical protein [Halomonas campisalis]
MSEARPPERRPIVPDPDASVSRLHRARPPAPRLWPLYVLLLLLLAAVGALGWLGWQESQRLDTQWERLAGEMSNVHARFDVEEERGARLEGVMARLGALEERSDSIAARTTGLELELQRSAVGDLSWIEALSERQEELADQAATRDAMLGALQVSLDALERVGEQGREALATRLETLDEAGERRTQRLEAELEALNEALAAEREAWQSRLDPLADDLAQGRQAREALAEEMAWLQALVERRQGEQEERLEALSAEYRALADELEAQAASHEDEQEAVVALQGRLTAMEGELRELRQSQLALSAGLEALRQ